MNDRAWSAKPIPGLVVIEFSSWLASLHASITGRKRPTRQVSSAEFGKFKSVSESAALVKVGHRWSLAHVILKTQKLLLEIQLDDAGRSVAVLGDHHLGFTWMILDVVHFGAVQKHDDVGVLFNGAALPHVRQSRALVV